MRLAVVFVHYRTPELVPAALAALRADLPGPGDGVEWLLVDNGNDADGRALLDGLPLRRLDPGRNLGFAGGVNLGVRSVDAEILLVANPDVVALPGCATALLDVLGREAAIAGPRFFWDRDRRLVLPPGEQRSRRDEVLAWLALRGAPGAGLARARWRRHARRHWHATAPLASHALSGALLAFRRSAWNGVGPFDESYRLYFEETDWLLRARRLGIAARYVPAAVAIHAYGASARREPEAQRWFEASARHFSRRHYGAVFTGGLEAFDRLPVLPSRRGTVATATDRIDLAAFASPLWVEVSPLPRGFPAAGEYLVAPARSPWTPPAVVREGLGASPLYITASDERGRERARWRLCAGETP